MYIYIYGDGEPMVSATCNDIDMALCDKQFISVIDVSGEIPLKYAKGSWSELESIDDD